MLFFFEHLKLESFLTLPLGLSAHFGKFSLHALCYGQFQLAFCVVKLALFLDKFRLGVLSLCQLLITRFENLL